MAGRRRPLTGPGASPQTAKRTLYIRLMKQGESNLAACRILGINRKTGHRWLHGRTDTTADGRVKTYPSIMLPSRTISARFLSEAERVAIADGLVGRRSIRSIAAEIGRSPSTVSREIRRNRHPGTHRYVPFGAQRRAAARRARPRARKLAINAELGRFVAQHLEARWSPEQISGRLVRAFPERADMRVAPETIYQALWTRRKRASECIGAASPDTPDLGSRPKIGHVVDEGHEVERPRCHWQLVGFEPVCQTSVVIVVLALRNRSPGGPEGGRVFGDEWPQGEGRKALGPARGPGEGRTRSGLDSLVRSRYHDAIVRQSAASSNHMLSSIEP